MSSQLVAHMMRIKQYVDQCKEHNDSFTPAELDHLVESSRVVFTAEVADLVELLVKQIRRTVERAEGK